MATIIRCQYVGCGKKVSIRDELVGSKVKCPHCGSHLDTTNSATEQAAAATAVTTAPAAAPACPAPAPVPVAARLAPRYLAVLRIPYTANAPILIAGVACLLLFPIVLLRTNRSTLWGWLDTVESFVLLLIGLSALGSFIINLFNRPALILDKKSIKLRRQRQIESQVPYANITLVEIGEQEGEEGEIYYAIKLRLRDGKDPETVWPLVVEDGACHIFIDEGFNRPLGEICDLIQERTPNLMELRPKGKRKRARVKSEAPAPRRSPRGLAALAIIAPFALILALLAPFFSWAASLATGLGALATILAVGMVLYIVHRKKLYRDFVSHIKKEENNWARIATAMSRQFYWAQRQPRVFASWVILECLGLTLLVVGMLLGPRAVEPVFLDKPPLAAGPAPPAVPEPPPPEPKQPTPEPVDPVVAALANLDSDNAAMRAEAADDLSLLAPVDEYQLRIAAKLATQVERATPGTRQRYINALANWATPAEVPALIRVIESADASIDRGPAFDALARLKDQRGIAAVVRCLGDCAEAEMAIRALGPLVEQELALLFTHEDRTKRQRAVRLLAELGTPAILNELQALADGDDASIRDGARQTMRAISVRHNLAAAEPEPRPAKEPPAPQPPDAVAVAFAKLDRDDPASWRAGAEELLNLPPNPAQRANVVYRLTARIEAARGPVRYLLIQALTAWGAETEVPVFIRILDDHSEPSACRLALEFVAKHKDKRAAAAVVRSLGVIYGADAAIRAMGPVVEQELARLLTTNMWLCGVAADLLGEIGTPAVLPQLQAVADSENLRLRNSASAAVQAIASRHNLAAADLERTAPPKKTEPVAVAAKPAPPTPKAEKPPKIEAVGDVRELIGAWSTNSGLFDEEWTVSEKEGAWTVVCRYLRSGKEAGRFHAEKLVLENGVLTFLQVFDARPTPLWPDGTTISIRAAGKDKLTYSWRGFIGNTGGGELRRLVATAANPQPVDIAKAESFLGVWQGINTHGRFKEVWTVTSADGTLRVTCKFFNGDVECGAHHGEDCRLENGILVSHSVYDKKPRPEYRNYTVTMKLVDANSVHFDWRDAAGFTGYGRLVRKANAAAAVPIENNKAGGPADIAKAESFQGVWHAKSIRFEEVWSVSNDGGKWSIVCKFLRNGAEHGTQHGEDVRLENGALIFRSVYDRKPVPTWNNSLVTWRVLDANTIEVGWRDDVGFTGGGRLTRVATKKE